MAQSQEKTKFFFNVILLGDAGAGKSASGNTILGRTAFSTGTNTKTAFQKESATIGEVRVHVYDTPSFDLKAKTGMAAALLSAFTNTDPSGPFMFLLVVRADNFTETEVKHVEEIEKRLGDWCLNTWILFTRGDELKRKGTTVEKLIEEKQELRRLVERFQNRYHVFDNKSKCPDQVKILIENMKKAPLFMLPEMKKFPRKTAGVSDNPRERRIVLLGKTGAGKSSSGNTILGEKRFKSEFSFTSVTGHCEIERADVLGRNVSVLDTPGLFDTINCPEKIAREIGRSVFLSRPGVHAFIYVLKLDRFTEQEMDVVNKCEMIFGEEMRKYMMILFTCGDQIEGKNIDELIKQNKSLSKLVDQCGGGYHVFNNKDQNNRDQLKELMEKIDRMVEENGRTYYSNQMFEDAGQLGWAEFLKKYCYNLLTGIGIGVFGIGALLIAVFVVLLPIFVIFK